MPRAKKQETETKEIKTETVEKAYESIPRFQLGEMAHLGVNVFNGVTTDEMKRELNFPASVKTYKQMQYHGAINASLTLFDNIISKVEWKFNPPSDATEQEKEQCKIIQSMMHDMDQSWTEFVSDVLSCNIFGFSVHEKVYRRRYKSNGSKYNDGVIAWKKLPIRSQESIEKFLYDDSGNEITGVKQNLSLVNNPSNKLRLKNEIIIPASKMLLFRTGKHRGDPFGKSPLRNAYLSWRFITVLEELEAVSVSKDISGIPLLYLPPQYLSADASPEQKAIRAQFENQMRNMHMNNQTSIILPAVYDEVTKQKLFSLELLSMDGKKSFDLNAIKAYYQNAIYTSLSADILLLGTGSTGSFALAQFKNSIAAANAEALAKMICEVIQKDLITQTYELNGWNTDRMGSMDYDGLEAADLETFSKFIQRAAAVGLVPKTLDVINTILEMGGMDKLPEETTQEELDVMLTPETSKSGTGMEQGLPSGTGNAVSENNTSDLNTSNAA